MSVNTLTLTVIIIVTSAYIVCGQDVRLAGSSSSKQGRLEVYYNGSWGTVCSNSFDDSDAAVVCNSLGLGYKGTVVGNQYGPGNGTIWLDEVQCIGNETSIAKCDHSGWGVHNCSHGEDVSVSCSTLPGEYDVRLAGSSLSNEGRVEIYYNGSWGTVCDDYFDRRAADVACRSLGFKHGTVAGNQYGPGTGTIWLDQVQCIGNETSIADCTHDGWGVHDCAHYEDVSVACFTSPPQYHDVRLAGSSLSNEGRLEVNYGGVWGTVCDVLFDDVDAGVVCRSLGFEFVLVC